MVTTQTACFDRWYWRTPVPHLSSTVQYAPSLTVSQYHKRIRSWGRQLGMAQTLPLPRQCGIRERHFVIRQMWTEILPLSFSCCLDFRQTLHFHICIYVDNTHISSALRKQWENTISDSTQSTAGIAIFLSLFLIKTNFWSIFFKMLIYLKYLW